MIRLLIYLFSIWILARLKGSLESERLARSAAVCAAFEEAVVDAYDEHEQYSGLLTLIEGEVAFPFNAKVIDEDVSVVGMEWPEHDGFGPQARPRWPFRSMRIRASAGPESAV